MEWLENSAITRKYLFGQPLPLNEYSPPLQPLVNAFSTPQACLPRALKQNPEWSVILIKGKVKKQDQDPEISLVTTATNLKRWGLFQQSGTKLNPKYTGQANPRGYRLRNKALGYFLFLPFCILIIIKFMSIRKTRVRTVCLSWTSSLLVEDVCP